MLPGLPQTQLSPDIARALAGYRMIIGKVQVLLAHRGSKLSPLAALTLASLPEGRITVREAKRQGLILGSQVYQTVEMLHRAGLVRCSGGDKEAGRLAMEMTEAGAELGAAVRAAFAERETQVEAAE